MKNFAIISSYKDSETICQMLIRKWNILEEIMSALKIPYQATIVMQKEDYKLSDFNACWILMRSKLNKLKNIPNSTKLAEYVLDGLAERRNQLLENRSMVTALALDPRFCGELSDCQKEIARQTLAECWSHLETENGNNSIELNKSIDDDITVENTTILSKYLGNKGGGNNNRNDINIVQLLNDFIQQDHQFENQTILDFWNSQKSHHPELYQLAEIIFSISPTQVTVERSFSTLSYVFNSRRNQLSEESLETILLIALNKELFETVNQQDIKALNSHLMENTVSKESLMDSRYA